MPGSVTHGRCTRTRPALNAALTSRTARRVVRSEPVNPNPSSFSCAISARNGPPERSIHSSNFGLNTSTSCPRPAGRSLTHPPPGRHNGPRCDGNSPPTRARPVNDPVRSNASRISMIPWRLHGVPPREARRFSTPAHPGRSPHRRKRRGNDVVSGRSCDRQRANLMSTTGQPHDRLRAASRGRRQAPRLARRAGPHRPLSPGDPAARLPFADHASDERAATSCPLPPATGFSGDHPVGRRCQQRQRRRRGRRVHQDAALGGLPSLRSGRALRTVRDHRLRPRDSDEPRPLEGEPDRPTGRRRRAARPGRLRSVHHGRNRLGTGPYRSKDGDRLSDPGDPTHGRSTQQPVTSCAALRRRLKQAP